MSRVRLLTVTACLFLTAVQAWGQGSLWGTGDETGIPKDITLTPGVYATKWTVPPPVDFFSPAGMSSRPVFGEILQKPAAYKSLPKLESKSPIYGKLSFMSAKGRGPEVGFILDESNGSGTGYDSIYVDADGSGDLSNAQKCIGKRMGRSGAPRGMEFRNAAMFPMSKLTPGNKNSAALDIAVMASDNGKAEFVMCVLRGCLVGEVDTSSGKIPFQLADNGTQRYDNPAGHGNNPEMGAFVSFDWAKTGEGISFIDDDSHFMLSGAANVNGKLYTLKSDAEGSKLEVANYEGPTGFVGVKYVKIGNVSKPIISAKVAGKSSFFNIPVGNKPILVPVGDYKLVNIDINYSDDARGYWSVSGSQNKNVSVAEGKTAEISVGGAISMNAGTASKAVVFTRGKQGSVPFTFALATGASVDRLTAMPGGSTRQSDFSHGPRVQIKNAAGKVVLSGKAEFG